MHGLQNCTSLRFSPSTDHLIAMSQTGVCIADSISGKTLTREDGPLFASAQLQFSDNGHQPAFFNATEVRLFDLKIGMWIGQPLLSDTGILLASPLPKEASVLIVEQSGAIRKLPVQAATTNPDVKTPSANSGELLQQTAVLTAAAFRHSTGRLLVGTKDGRLVSVLVP